MTLEFTPDAIERIAELATLVNERTENIGARRLHTVMERLLDEVSFHAPELGGHDHPHRRGVRRSHAGGHRQERRSVALHPVTRPAAAASWPRRSRSPASPRAAMRGAPQAPLRRLPARVTDLEARRLEDRIELRFTIPGTNSDGSTPPTVERVEIYRPAPPVAAGPPSIAQVVAPGNPNTTITVKPPQDPEAPTAQGAGYQTCGGRADDRRRQARWRQGGPPADASVAHYVVVGLTGRRKGPTSPIVTVPLVDPPAPPQFPPDT